MRNNRAASQARRSRCLPPRWVTDMAKEAVKAEEIGTMQRLEAKMDQLLGDNKRLQQEVAELKDWTRRMVRVVKAK